MIMRTVVPSFDSYSTWLVKTVGTSTVPGASAHSDTSPVRPS